MTLNLRQCRLIEKNLNEEWIILGSHEDMPVGGYCGSLNRCGPPSLKCLNAWTMGSGTIVGVGVALLEELPHCGGELWRPPI